MLLTLRLSAVFSLCLLATAQPAKRPMKLDDMHRMADVRDPQVSPDGKQVAFIVSTVDVKDDKSLAQIWTVNADGTDERQVTFSGDRVSTPRWSPDGKYLSFTASRPGAARGNQVWLMDRRGGEASQLTATKGRLQSYEWSPDSKRLALVIGDPDPDGDAEAESGARAQPRVPKPIVIDRYKFKQDVQGYLLSGRRSYVYLFDVEKKKLERLTTQTKWDESSPSWSPDSSRIAFLSNHSADPDRENGAQIFVAAALPGVSETAITPAGSRAGRGRPEWSPDGQTIAFTESDERKWGAYNMDHLTLVAADGSSAPRRLKAAEALDRSVSSPRFTPDGASVEFLVTDDMSVYTVRAKTDGSSVERMMSKPVVVSSISSAGGTTVAISGGDSRAGEIYVVAGGLKQISHRNDALMAELEIPATEEVSFKSRDTTEVHGLLTYPVGYVKGTKVPLLLRIHGGPNGQDQHSFSMERQLFAANGYAVLAVNYRGSAGRGQKFSRSIYADWGHFEVEDLLAGVDHVVKMGVADPARLGVGGWSYGGILTDYLIASDTRFKAATSGAGTAFTVSFYGTDQYIIQYDNEIGPPWTPKGWETYVKISYPFLHADRIKTPTLFLGGEKDFNVPIEGGQQMYQALRSLGVDTQLVIYPNEFHGIQRPSYQRDRAERYLAWYDKYVLGKAAITPAAATASGGR